MKYFSYVDTTLRSVIINAYSQNLNKELYGDVLESLEGRRKDKLEKIRENIIYQLRNNKELYEIFIHECHHYWQTFHYPFLYLLSWLEFNAVFSFRRYLRTGDEVEMEKISRAMRYSSLKVRFVWTEKGLSIDPNVDGQSIYDNNVFCLLDLIEDATTIFQYKTTNESPNAEGFYKWVKNPRNRSYKKLYKFLMRKYGKEYAYYYLPIFTQIAFQTTEPAGAFCSLINISIDDGYQYQANWNGKEYEELKEILLRQYPNKQLNFADYIEVSDIPVTVIESQDFQKLIELSENHNISLHYPISLHARKHLKLKAEQDDYEEILLNPTKSNIDFLFGNFYPVFTHFNFLDLNSRQNAIIVSEDYLNKKIALSKDFSISYMQLIPEIMRKKDITLSIFTDINTVTPHNCHHTDCKFHATNYCRKWSAIPKYIEDCSFPSWFESEYFYRIDTENRNLNRINNEELKNAKNQYDKLVSKFLNQEKFEYVIDLKKNNIILKIPKENIVNKDLDYIFRFIEQYSTRHKKHLQDFYGAILIDFSDYSDMSEEVFQIDEIVTYFDLLKIQFPFVLIFINDLSYILPIFIKHEVSFVGNNYVLKYNSKSQKAFVLNEVQEIYTFLNQAGIYDEEVVNSYILKLKKTFGL